MAKKKVISVSLAMAKKKTIRLSSSGKKDEEAISESLSTAMGHLTIGLSSSGKKKKKQKKKKKKAISESLATAMGFLTIGLSSSSGKKNESISRCSRSSPPKEKEKEKENEKTVYLSVNERSGYYGEFTELYEIKLSTKKLNEIGRVEEPLLIKSIPRNLNMPLSLWSCSVAVGSTIYCTSAADKASSLVIALDTTNLTTTNLPCYPERLEMNIERDGRFSVVVTDGDGKIYVFGGIKTYYDWWSGIDVEHPAIDDKFLCEVFDPTKNTWEPINPPPPSAAMEFLRADQLDQLDIFAVYDDTLRRILVGSLEGDGFLLCYNVRDAFWQILDQKFTTGVNKDPSVPISPGIRSRPVFFDNTLYWIGMHYCGLYAYDLDLQMLVCGTIHGIHPLFWECFDGEREIHHLRDHDFYLIWLDDCEVIRCERMRVFKQERSLTACVLSTQAYKLLDTGTIRGFSAVLL